MNQPLPARFFPLSESLVAKPGTHAVLVIRLHGACCLAEHLAVRAGLGFRGSGFKRSNVFL